MVDNDWFPYHDYRFERFKEAIEKTMEMSQRTAENKIAYYAVPSNLAQSQLRRFLDSIKSLPLDDDITQLLDPDERDWVIVFANLHYWQQILLRISECLLAGALQYLDSQAGFSSPHFAKYLISENLMTVNHAITYCSKWNGSLKFHRSKPYSAYIRSYHWSMVRQYALKNDGYRCKLCNSNKDLHVHHRSYDRRGEELLQDLTVLCSDCHALFHSSKSLSDGSTKVFPKAKAKRSKKTFDLNRIPE